MKGLGMGTTGWERLDERTGDGNDRMKGLGMGRTG